MRERDHERLGKIDEADLREEAVTELIKDAMEAGWAEMEIRKAIWSWKMLQDTKDMTQR